MGFFDRIKKAFGLGKPTHKRAPIPSQAKPAVRKQATAPLRRPKTARQQNIDKVMKTLKYHYGRDLNVRTVEKQLKPFSNEAIEKMANTTDRRLLNSIVIDESERLQDEGVEVLTNDDDLVTGVFYH
jgi:DNA-directed RNA polymerase specialized sigma subunit